MNSFHLKHLFPVISNFSKSDLVQLGDYVANYILCEDRYFYCPACIDTEIKKNGHINGKQRGVCLNCGKSFNLGQPSLMYKSRLPKEFWYKFIVEMFSLAYTDNLAVPKFECINKNTSTRMYNRCLDSLYEYAEELNDDMSDIIKTFTEENYLRITTSLKSKQALNN